MEQTSANGKLRHLQVGTYTEVTYRQELKLHNYDQCFKILMPSSKKYNNTTANFSLSFIKNPSNAPDTRKEIKARANKIFLTMRSRNFLEEFQAMCTWREIGWGPELIRNSCYTLYLDWIWEADTLEVTCSLNWQNLSRSRAELAKWFPVKTSSRQIVHLSECRRS